MKKLSLSLALSSCAWCAFAGEAIVTTAIARPTLGTNANALFVWLPSTNVVDIPNGQAARLVTFYWSTSEGNLRVVKNGLVWFPGRGDVIQGPAKFVLFTDAGREAGEVANGQPTVPPPNSVLMTLERWTVRKATAAQLRE